MTKLLEELAVVLTLDSSPAVEEVKEIQSHMNQATRSVEISAQDLQRAGRRMTAMLTAPILAFGAASAYLFAEFDKNMRNVNTIARQSESQLRSTTGRVMELADAMALDPSGLANALYSINSASFVGAEGLELLEASATAGRAGLATTEEAAKTITAILNAYGKSAREASDVSDILFKTIEKGVTTFPELAGSLGTVIATASAAKVPFEEVAAAIATMTKGGINTAEATTALNRTIMRLIQGTEELNVLFAQTEEGTAAAYLQTRGLGATMKFLAEQTGGEAEALIKLGFRMRDLKAVLSLTRNEGKAFEADLAEIADRSNRAGATVAAFKEQTKSLSYSLDEAKVAGKSLSLEVGQTLAPVIKDAVAFLKEAVDVYKSLDEEQQKTIIVVAAVVAAVGPLVLLAGTLAASLAAIGAATPLIAIGLLIVGVVGLTEEIGKLSVGIDETGMRIDHLREKSEIFNKASREMVRSATDFEKAQKEIQNTQEGTLENVEAQIKAQKALIREMDARAARTREIRRIAAEVGGLVRSQARWVQRTNDEFVAAKKHLKDLVTERERLARLREEEERQAAFQEAVSKATRDTNEAMKELRREASMFGSEFSKKIIDIQKDFEKVEKNLAKVMKEAVGGPAEEEVRRLVELARKENDKFRSTRMQQLRREADLEIALFTASAKERAVIELELQRKKLLEFAKTEAQKAAIAESFQKKLLEIDKRFSGQDMGTRERLGIIEKGSEEALRAELGVDDTSRQLMKQQAQDTRDSKDILEDIRDDGVVIQNINKVQF